MLRKAVIETVLAAVSVACGSDADTDDDNGSDSNSDVTRLWVDSELADCVGEVEQECLQISRSEDGELELFYDPIEGFSFVEGNEYVIDVTIEEVDDPPADGSSLRYTLVDVVEEKAADS